MIDLGRDLRRLYRPLLEINDPAYADRVYGSDRLFKIPQGVDVEGLRVLLLDDTLTSGATIQSAASALSRTGAEVAAGVVVGRVIGTDDPAYPHRTEAWERQRKIPFSFATCCLDRA